jgi:hypothetical protein
MRDWQIRTDMLVLHGTDREIPGQRAVIKQDGREYQVQHWFGVYTMYQEESRPTLVGAIRLAERWVR